MYLVRIEFCARFNQSRSGLDQKSAPQSRLETKKKKLLASCFYGRPAVSFMGRALTKITRQCALLADTICVG